MTSVKKKTKGSAPLLRRQTEYFLVGQPAPALSGSKLPTARAVLRHLFYVSKRCKQNDAFRHTVENVLSFWNMARIPTKLPRNCVRKLSKLWNEWRAIDKGKRRSKDPAGTRERFQSKLDKLWDIGADDAIEQIMSNRLLDKRDQEEDVQFYLDQQTARVATMSGNDKKFEERLQKRERRDQRAERLRQAAIQPGVTVMQLPDSEDGEEDVEMRDDDDEDDADGCEEDSSSGPMDTAASCPSRTRPKRTGTVQLHLPRDILQSPAILDVADRFQMSIHEVNKD